MRVLNKSSLAHLQCALSVKRGCSELLLQFPQFFALFQQPLPDQQLALLLPPLLLERPGDGFLLDSSLG
jgi:hypothetical protein